MGQASRSKGHATGQTVWPLCQEECPRFRALPAVACDARRTQCLLVNNRAIIQREGAQSSVPSTWVGRTITAAMGVEEMCLGWQGATHVDAKQPRGAQAITYRHDLPELARKPQAVRQVAPALLPELGEPSQTLGAMWAKTHGEREAARVVTKLVAAIVVHGEGAVTTALTHVMQSESADLHGVREWLQAVPLPTRIAVPERLAGYEGEAGQASDDDFLLAGGLR